MKTVRGLILLLLTSVALLSFTPKQDGTLQQHFLRNCEVDVNPEPTDFGFSMLAYYRENANNATETTVTVSFAPPHGGIGLANFWADENAYVQMRVFTENKAVLTYHKTTPPTVSLRLSNGDSTQDQSFSNTHFTGFFDTLRPIHVSTQDLTDKNIDHGRQRIIVEFRGIRTGFTLLDL